MVEVGKGRCFSTYCCHNGHHKECNQQGDIEKRAAMEDHNFIALTSDKFSVLAVALTSHNSKYAACYGCIYKFESEDIDMSGRLAGRSLVRYDRVCRINKNHIIRVENTVISNTGIKKILKKLEDFVVFS